MNLRIILSLLILGNLFLAGRVNASSHEDCLPVHAGELEIITDSGRIILQDDFSRLLDFELSQLSEAITAKSIIEFYGFTEQCFVGRADASMMYWLVSGRTPQGPYDGEDCIPMRNLEVQLIDGRWTIVQETDDGTIFFSEFGSNEDEARLALRIMTERGFEYQCFVGRADASMEYYRTDADSDGDGLLDTWETIGFDADGDGSVDIDLPGMGARANHKDLFLEFDWMTGEAPTQEAIQAMKQAFAAAPVNAGGVANPDGLPGINLWVDTGSLTDANGIEDGSAAGSCGDGVDNGGDGVIDANDPDCLVGDNLGGGNSFAASDISNLNSDFYAAKAANFNANRAMIFRYGISARPKAGFGGGWGEIGGNDFIEYNHDGGTIMHELGHTLNLRHGGDVNDNCKPNYISVMNYDNQFGINQAGGGSIIDYSPPRFAGGRGQAPLGALTENNLNEATLLDNTDATNQFVFVNANGAKVRNPTNQAVNWNADTDTTDSGLTVNIDTSSTATGRPAACTNASSTDILSGYDDWTNIVLNFRPFGDSANGAINPVTEPEPDLEDLILMQEELNTTDVMIEKSADPNPVEVGDELVYTLKVTNNGPNPASKVQVVDDLPDLVTYMSNTAGCSVGAGSVLTCDMGEFLFKEDEEIDITVDTDNVCINGIPSTITNQADVENTAEFAVEADTSNDSATLTMTPVDTTPPSIICPSNTTIECDQSPDPDLTGSASATDVCDSSPTITFTDTIIPGTCPEEETIQRTWTAEDARGNSSSCVQTIEVVDTTPPDIQCNAPSTIKPTDAPISFTATATDNCAGDPSVEIIGYDCYEFTKKGKRIDKTESCIIEVNGETITIVDSGGVDDNITWTVRANDNCGNVSDATCSVMVVNPGKH
jgi:uncharacterized repeat protein (TIGR01451 family)